MSLSPDSTCAHCGADMTALDHSCRSCGAAREVASSTPLGGSTMVLPPPAPAPSALSGATSVQPAPAAPRATLGGSTMMAPAATGSSAEPDPRLAGATRGLTIMGAMTSAAETDVTELPPGAVFDGRYSVVSTLGVGGMGAVYQAVDTQLNQLVALKALRPEIAGS